MRSAAQHLANAVLMCSALLACSEAPACERCGVAIVATGADADAVFPPAVGTSVGNAVGDLIFLKLADIGIKLNTIGDAGFEPRLARSWKWEDSVTIAFELDPRARWQDGTPVTAGDVAFTYSVYSDPAVGASAQPLLSTIASVTARDEKTAVFRFKQPYPEQFYDATYHMRVIPKHLLDTIPHAGLSAHALARTPIGSGPYRLTSWKTNETIDLSADTAFFLGAPAINRVVFRVTGDVNASRAQVVAGQADLLEYVGTGPDVEEVKKVAEYRVITSPSAAFNYILLNLHDPATGRPHALLGDRDFRRALVQGIDMKSIVTAVLGEYAQLPLGPISRLTPLGNDTLIPQLTMDTSAARATLERLGWKDANGDGIREKAGKPLELELTVPGSSPNRVRLATFIQEQLKRVGVAIKVDQSEMGRLQRNLGTHKFTASFMSWSEDPSPSGIRQLFTTGAYRSGVNFGGYSNPEFDRLVNQAVLERDTIAARAHWRKALGLINEDAPAIWMYSPVQPIAVHSRYENVTIQPDQWLRTLWSWRIAPARMIERDRRASTGSAPAQ